MKARVLVVDVIGDKGVYETEVDDLQDIYDALRCDCFDIAYRKVGGKKKFDIFCDDIGLFAENPIVSALDEKMCPALVGNLLFANHDMEGNTTSLSDEDVQIIKDNIITLIDFDSDPIRQWVAVMPVEY